MENVMTNVFTELSAVEMETVAGGYDPGLVVAGGGLIVACLGVAVAAAAVPFTLPALAAGALVVGGGIGGYTMGTGFIS